MLSHKTFEAMCDAASSGEPEELEKLMIGLDEKQLCLALSQLNERGHSLLLILVNSLFRKTGHYRCAILLLERGADPLLPQKGESYDRTPMFSAIISKQSGLIHLMMPYAPAFNLAEWSHKSPLFPGWMRMSAIDFKKADELEKNAETLLTEKKYDEAATAYTEITSIYAKHEILEATAVVADHDKFPGCTDRIFYYSSAQLGYISTLKIDATPAELRDVAQQHFHNKKMHYLKKVYACYKSAKGSVDAVSTSDITLDGLAGDDRSTPPAAGFGVATTIATTIRRRLGLTRSTAYHAI